MVAKWIGVYLLMPGTLVGFLVWEDPTSQGAMKPRSHNYWACVLARMLQPLKPKDWQLLLRSKRSHHKEKTGHCSEDPAQPKIK